MPGKHALKTYTPNSYYHIFNRGVNKAPIFFDDQDKYYFLALFDRYLNPSSDEQDINNVSYPKYDGEIELGCYCLMDNHYHLLVWVDDDKTALPAFMRSISTAYVKYFNQKYDRVGPLFQGRYNAVYVGSDEQLVHLTRYIHLNPDDCWTNPFTSLNCFLGGVRPLWLHNSRIVELLAGMDYRAFMKAA